ncbi:ATP-binding protein [Gramella sp. GC03-9]|uniref:ATP-binding protein n=1 Tax=Christiangramia oceanisediminis TaxID=2920386 RepID=A0A9X2L012_9FLAO|nr:ATP-binding protein [Gramella oceanisediminis]MCP9201351.1 ATP-binding protein [Gramella oceanisediminis]
MNLRPLFFICSLLMLSISACESSASFSEDAQAVRKDSAFILFEKGKTAKDLREKISYFNKALKELKFKKDTIIPDILDYKIYYHVSLKEYDSSLYFSDSLINTARAQQDSAYLAKAYYRKASAFRNLNQYEKQFKNSFASREIYLRIGDTSNAGRRTSEMASAQSQLTDYTGAQQTATEALEYLKENDSVYLSSIYNTIATTYRNQGLYDDAAKEWNNALRYASSSRDSLSNLNNIALALQDEKRFDEAIRIFESILERSDLTVLKSRARFMDNLAYTKWLQDPSAPVLEDLLKAKEIRRRQNDENGLLASYDHLSDYFRDKNSQLSKKYSDSLLLIAKNTGSQTAQLNAIQKLIDLSPAEKTKGLSTQYIRLNDSIRSENLRAKNLFAKIRYDEEQKQREINNLHAKALQQKLQTEELKNQTIILSLGGLLLMVSGGFGFYYLRQKHEREKIKEAHDTETRISKKIHDELANDVYNVMSGMQEIAPVAMMDKLEHIYKRTRNISRENSSIPLGQNYLPHLISTLSSATSEDTRLILRGEDTVKWDSLTSEKKIIIYRVLQEIMINMNKHSQASLVAIIFSEERNLLKIQYSDNGIGTSENQLKSGNGLQNVENRIFSIKGKLTFETETDRGLKIFIQIPI